MTTIFLFSAFTSFPLRPFDVAFQLEEARALRGVEDLAAELDRERGRVAAEARQQRDLHALEHLGGLGELLLGERRERADEAVGEQDAEEGADQRVRDQLAELGGRQAD